MTEQEKIQLLKDGLSELFNFNPDFEITPDTEFEKLNLDSLEIVEFQMYIEEKAKVQTLDPTGKIETVKDFFQLIP